jgi:hypothetical protein
VAEFFFGSWPEGVGPNLIQFVLLIAGAIAGVRAIDDVRAWLSARSRNRSAPDNS